MKGSDIIKIIGVPQIHCSLTKVIFEIDPEYDYLILKGTNENPKVFSTHAIELINAGKFPRLTIEENYILSDIEWTTGHHSFEGEVEPKFSPDWVALGKELAQSKIKGQAEGLIKDKLKIPSTGDATGSATEGLGKSLTDGLKKLF